MRPSFHDKKVLVRPSFEALFLSANTIVGRVCEPLASIDSPIYSKNFQSLARTACALVAIARFPHSFLSHPQSCHSQTIRMGRLAPLWRSLPRAATSTSRTTLALRTARLYSIKAEAASTAQQKPIDPSKLSIKKTNHPSPLSKPEDLVFGRTFTGKPYTSTHQTPALFLPLNNHAFIYY